MFYFNLKATNGQVIGTSVMHADEATRSAAVAEIRTAAKTAGVVGDL